MCNEIQVVTEVRTDIMSCIGDQYHFGANGCCRLIQPDKRNETSS